MFMFDVKFCMFIFCSSISTSHSCISSPRSPALYLFTPGSPCLLSSRSAGFLKCLYSPKNFCQWQLPRPCVSNKNLLSVCSPCLPILPLNSLPVRYFLVASHLRLNELSSLSSWNLILIPFDSSFRALPFVENFYFSTRLASLR